MTPLPPHEQRHPFLRYQGLEYTDADIRMPELMRDGLFTKMVMKHCDDAGVVVFTSRAWGRLFDTRGLLVWELILEPLSTLRFGEVLLDLDAPDTIQFQLGGAKRRLSWRHGDFLGPPLSYTLIRDPLLRLFHRMMAHRIAGLDVGSINIPYLLARYLRRDTSGLTVIAPTLLVIDMATLVRLQICVEINDTWAWVALGPERQLDAVAGTPEVAKDDPIDDKGGQAVLAPVQASQPPPPPVAARTMPQRFMET
ncbi:hypothetical protein Tco_1433801, partial [Tanacetum coccineum]